MELGRLSGVGPGVSPDSPSNSSGLFSSPSPLYPALERFCFEQSQRSWCCRAAGAVQKRSLLPEGWPQAEQWHRQQRVPGTWLGLSLETPRPCCCSETFSQKQEAGEEIFSWFWEGGV